MVDPVAQRLWEVARKKQGTIIVVDASRTDLDYGVAKGWIMKVGIGHYEAKPELRRAVGAA